MPLTREGTGDGCFCGYEHLKLKISMGIQKCETEASYQELRKDVAYNV